MRTNLRRRKKRDRIVLDSSGSFRIAAPKTVWSDGQVVVRFDSASPEQAEQEIDKSLLPIATRGSLLSYLIQGL